MKLNMAFYCGCAYPYFLNRLNRTLPDLDEGYGCKQEEGIATKIGTVFPGFIVDGLELRPGTVAQ